MSDFILSPKFSFRMQILEFHLDCFGHVNNATYLQILESARWDYCKQNNYGLEDILREQKGPVILEANIQFKRELKNREWIEIISQAKAKKDSRIMEIEQKIMKTADATLSAVATFKVGFFDLQTRKLIPPTAEWAKAAGFSSFE